MASSTAFCWSITTFGVSLMHYVAITISTASQRVIIVAHVNCDVQLLMAYSKKQHSYVKVLALLGRYVAMVGSYARELQPSTQNTSRIAVSLCVCCSPMSKIKSNIWPRKSRLWSDTFLIHVIWPLTIVSNDEIASYTQFQKVSSSVASKSRRKTHSINLEGTGLKGTTIAMLRIHPATNAGWKLFSGQLYTHTNQRYIICP
jgi:hypothetical protein